MADDFLSLALRCPHCRKLVHSQTGRTLGEWLAILKPLEVQERHIRQHYQELAKQAKKEPSPNDVVWRVLNWLVGEHRDNPRGLHRVYLEQAELVASELRNPEKQQELASQYPPYSWMLERNLEPLDFGIARFYEARDLEREGKTEEAIAIYEFLIQHKIPDDRPFERLRIVYTKQKKYKDAIRICKAALRAPKSLVQEGVKKKLAEWIPKLEKLEAAG